MTGRKTLKLQIDLESDELATGGYDALAALLKTQAGKIGNAWEGHEPDRGDSGTIYDTNGVRVGYWAVSLESDS
jgi:hypothetical protein